MGGVPPFACIPSPRSDERSGAAGVVASGISVSLKYGQRFTPYVQPTAVFLPHHIDKHVTRWRSVLKLRFQLKANVLIETTSF
jgi:hypothetical protein